ncbi:MAG: T9SS type A sorting domain-containing protein [Flavobacteriales bacterium]|nr:T9SS type A sorting domain-containing protein [Flavobacteriales bacterium]MCB9449142.1 T9SS type A sorting domain-containing protein [Flavobacteriales bacterium]
MKKIYFLAGAAFFMSSVAFAQQGNMVQKDMKPAAQNDLVASPANVQDPGIAAVGDTIWSEDFKDSIPAGWTVVDNTSNGYDWVWTTNPTISCTYTSTTFAASTATNGHMLLFGDKYNSDVACTLLTQPVVDMDAFFQTPAMDYTAYPSVFLKFQQSFRYCCNSGTTKLSVYVSNDSITWKEYNVKGKYPFIQGTGANAASKNPTLQTVNISDVAGGQSKVWIRWHMTAGSHYYWQVDDIAVVEGNTEDAVLIEELADFNYIDGGFYTMLPRKQGPNTPVTFRSAVFNNGSSTLNNVTLNVKVKDASSNAVYDQTSAAKTLSSMQLDTFAITTPFMADTSCSDIGDYTFEFTIDQTETDQDPANNTISVPFTVTDTVFGRDYGVAGTTGGPDAWADCTADGNEIATMYEFSADATATSISFYNMSSTDSSGISVILNLYRLDINGNIGSSPYASSDLRDLTTADLGKWITMPFTSPVTVEADSTFLASVAVFGYNNGYDINIGTDLVANQPDATSLTNCAGTWGWISSQPMIRLNANDGSGNFCVGVNEIENAHNLRVFPNPNQGTFNLVAENLKGKTTTIQVTNVIGQVIYSKEVRTGASYMSETVDLSSAQKGLYFVKLINNNAESVHKVIVQ